MIALGTEFGGDAGDAAADPFDASVVLGAPPVLAEFNRAGVLAASDVHVAMRLARLGGERDDDVVLAAALAVRGPRHGHVRVDLLDAPQTLTSDLDDSRAAQALPWPDPGEWTARLAASPLVSVGPDGPVDRPLRLVGTALYLDRYWRDEAEVASQLRTRLEAQDSDVDEAVMAEGLRRLFRSADDGGELQTDQRDAAEAAIRRRLSVIAGGPGTGKTTTVAKVIALVFDQANAARSRRPLVALAAPTGKAAARMQEAVRAASTVLDVPADTRECLAKSEAMTVHRLLRRRPDSSSRFAHDRFNRLPHDVVIVDEMSMVSLSLMARLLEAVRPDARLILVGDPEQLASVEAGAVMADVVAGLGDRISRLTSNYRFAGGLAALSDAVSAGDPDRVVEVLRDAGDGKVQWIDAAGDAGSAVSEAVGAGGHAGDAREESLAPLREAVDDFGRALLDAATEGDEIGALQALGRFRVLCAHRKGHAGVEGWTARIESWLSADVEGFAPDTGWYLGRPVMVTANDYSLRLFNGDTGVVVTRPGGLLTTVFDQGGRPVSVSPSRLSNVETVFAMTVHKSQGSEFDHVAVVLPPVTSPLLTRELLYTAITRARRSLLLIAPEDSVRAAVEQRVARTSGLAGRLRP